MKGVYYENVNKTLEHNVCSQNRDSNCAGLLSRRDLRCRYGNDRKTDPEYLWDNRVREMDGL